MQFISLKKTALVARSGVRQLKLVSNHFLLSVKSQGANTASWRSVAFEMGGAIIQTSNNRALITRTPTKRPPMER